MLGSLIKQLVAALGRYFRHYARRVLVGNDGSGKPPITESPSPAAAAIAPAPPSTAASTGEGLDTALIRPVQWPRRRINEPHEEITSNSLYQLWTAIPGGLKWTHYFEAYQSIFGPIRTRPLRILEIGVWRGASLRLWRQYFENPKTVIVGVDLLSECLKYDAPAEGVHIRVGSQADVDFMRRVVDEFGPFDLIIDDGSHRSSHIIASFNQLFLTALNDTGIYFVEDFHTNYWHPWRDSKSSFLDICKELMELMHAHYRAAPQDEFLVNSASDQPIAALEVPLITTLIKEIRVFDSMAAIFKTRRSYIPHFLSTPD